MVQKTMIYSCMLLVTVLFSSSEKGRCVYTVPEITSSVTKINGISFEAPPTVISSAEINSIATETNGNWLAIIPFGYTRENEGLVNFNSPMQWWGERDEGVMTTATYAREHHFKVMIKPQLWVRGGSYTGNYTLNSDEQWRYFEGDYAQYILHFARIADSLNADLYCIGTELISFVEARPDFWIDLIDSVKSIYRGAITYAGNWDSYQRVPFWDQLDYIGIDAYFPLSDAVTPTIQELEKKYWVRVHAEIDSFRKIMKKPVLFTEYGYRSIDQCALEPWSSSSRSSVNLTGQSNAYQALYQCFWQEDWFAGGFLWKWHANIAAGGTLDDDFTPQNKPVLKIIREFYK